MRNAATMPAEKGVGEKKTAQNFKMFTKFATLYVSQSRTNNNNLLRFKGRIKSLPNTSRRAAYILKDDGASDIFINRKLANKLVKDGAKTREAGQMQVRTGRRSQDPGVERRTKIYATLTINGYQISAWFTIFDLTDYNMILGKTQSVLHNLDHEIDHVHNILTIGSGKDAVVLQGLRPWEAGKPKDKTASRLASQLGINLLDAHEAVVEYWKNKNCFLVSVREDILPKDQDSDERAKAIQDDFKDLFKDLSSIPARRTAEFRIKINLENKYKIPYISLYRLILKEDEDL